MCLYGNEELCPLEYASVYCGKDNVLWFIVAPI